MIGVRLYSSCLCEMELIFPHLEPVFSWGTGLFLTISTERPSALQTRLQDAFSQTYVRYKHKSKIPHCVLPNATNTKPKLGVRPVNNTLFGAPRFRRNGSQHPNAGYERNSLHNILLN